MASIETSESDSTTSKDYHQEVERSNMVQNSSGDWSGLEKPDINTLDHTQTETTSGDDKFENTQHPSKYPDTTKQKTQKETVQEETIGTESGLERSLHTTKQKTQEETVQKETIETESGKKSDLHTTKQKTQKETVQKETIVTESGVRSDLVPCEHCQELVAKDSLKTHWKKCDKVDGPREEASLLPPARKKPDNERLNDLVRKLQEQQEKLDKKFCEQKAEFDKKECDKQTEEFNKKFKKEREALQKMIAREHQNLVWKIAPLVLLFAVVVVYFFRTPETPEINENSEYTLQQCKMAISDLQEQFNRTQKENITQLRLQLNQTRMDLQEQSRKYNETIVQLREQTFTITENQEEQTRNLSTVVSTISEQIREVNRSLQQDGNRINSESPTKEIEDMVRVMSGQVNKVIKLLGILPYEIIFPSFKENKDQLISDVMYTHYEGFKFNAVLSIEKDEDWEVDFSSVEDFLLVRVNSLRGDYDQKLSSRLPIKFTIKLVLLNQLTESDHYSRTLNCEINRIGEANICSHQYFILYSKLELNKEKQTDYSKDGSLKFRITSINVPK